MFCVFVCLGLVISIHLGKLKIMCKLTLCLLLPMELVLKGHWGCGSCAQRSEPGLLTLPQSWEEWEVRREPESNAERKKKINVKEKTKKKRYLKSVANYFYVVLCVKLYCLCCKNTPHELIVFGQTLRSTWSSSFDLMRHKNMKRLCNISIINDAFIDKNKELMRFLALLKMCFL